MNCGDEQRVRELHIRSPADLDKRGQSGKNVSCITNFVRWQCKTEGEIYQYHVVFTPPVDGKMERKGIIESLKDKIGSEYVFDGAILYIPNNIGDMLEYNSEHPHSKESVTVKIVHKLTLNANDPQAINTYNLLVRRSFEKLGYQQIGRNFYRTTGITTIRNYSMEILPGFITAVRQQEENLLMCIENSSRLLRTNNVNDMLKQYKRTEDRDIAAALVIGSTVVTRYNNKLYRVDDVDWSKNPTSDMVKCTITFEEYYLKQYNKVIDDKKQPLLVSRSKKRGLSSEEADVVSDIYLVPELCHMTGLSESMRADRRIMQEVARYTRLSPAERVSRAQLFIDALRGNAAITGILSNWHVSIGPELLRLTARELQTEELLGGTGIKYSYRAESGDWANETKKHGAYATIAMDTWALVFLRKDSNKADQFFKVCSELSHQMKMAVKPPIRVSPDDVTSGAFVNTIKGVLEKNKIQIVVVIVPTDDKTRYDNIKKLCCLDSPVSSQVILSKTLSNEKNFRSICLKVLLQMNCKMGGSLWKVHIPMQDAMVLGYDLYHDSTNRGKTVGAAVSSFDIEFTRWLAQCDLHANPTELGQNLGRFVEEALRLWHKKNGQLPKRVFIYRDGCSEGQLDNVRLTEVALVKRAFKSVQTDLGQGSDDIKLAFIVVTKRVNVRYFKVTDDNRSCQNPKPGTVVDSQITGRESRDWYLVPQCVGQGTVTPVNYNVIADDIRFGAEKHQRLAYKLCHLYYNWQGTIRVPAPCQYAQKLAFLTSQSLHEPASLELREKLYFL